MPDAPLFVVRNHHSASCGAPPQIDDRADDDIAYRAYFENEYGEQWLLLYRSSTGAVVVFSGDCGWDNELIMLPLKDVVEALPTLVGETLLEQANSQGLTQTPIVAGRDGPVLLSPAEQQWLLACMTAIRRRWPSRAEG